MHKNDGTSQAPERRLTIPIHHHSRTLPFDRNSSPSSDQIIQTAGEGRDGLGLSLLHCLNTGVAPQSDYLMQLYGSSWHIRTICQGDI